MRTASLRLVSGALLLATLAASPGRTDVTDPVPVLTGNLVRAPGPRALGFEGLAADPSSIGNFQGLIALAYLRGRVRDASGRRLVMADDIRVMQGDYVSADGVARHGTFAFV
jgi:hypothetical protein